MLELAYLILFSCIFIIGILGVTRKMSMGIALSGIGAGLIIAWIMAPYMEVVMTPIGQAIFYNGVWTISAILGLAHLVSLIAICILAGYNLMSSGGKITWA